jgi:hypothetical protein
VVRDAEGVSSSRESSVLGRPPGTRPVPPVDSDGFEPVLSCL